MSGHDKALELLGALVLEDGRRWGEAATEVQREDARAVLDPSGPPYYFLTRSRGFSKTTDLAGMAIPTLLRLPPGSRSYALAADREQGRLLLDAVDGFVRRTPSLGSAFEVGAWRVTCRRTGCSLDILAADAAGSWGLRPAFVVVDELSQWGTTSGPRRLWEAVSSACAKMEGSRLVVLTTGGDPAHWSCRVLEHARKDAMWRVHEVPGPAPWLDPAKLAGQKRRLPESSFRRLFLNEWTAAEDRLALPQDIASCVTLDGPLAPEPGRDYVIGLDLGLKRDRTVAAVAHAESVGEGVRVVLDRMEVWSGSRGHPVRFADVEEWLLQASASFNAARVILDPWQAVGMAQRLRSRGVAVDEFTFSSTSVGRLASVLHLLIRSHSLALPDDPDLIDELANVRLRETSPGVLRMDHDADQHDDRAIAVALAAQYVLDHAPEEFDHGAIAAGLAAASRELVRENPWGTEDTVSPWRGLE